MILRYNVTKIIYFTNYFCPRDLLKFLVSLHKNHHLLQNIIKENNFWDILYLNWY